jgi:hypothetical protein
LYFQPLPAAALAGRISALTWPRVRPPHAQGNDPSAFEQLEKDFEDVCRAAPPAVARAAARRSGG